METIFLITTYDHKLIRKKTNFASSFQELKSLLGKVHRSSYDEATRSKLSSGLYITRREITPLLKKADVEQYKNVDNMDRLFFYNIDGNDITIYGVSVLLKFKNEVIRRRKSSVRKLAEKKAKNASGSLERRAKSVLNKSLI